MAPPLINGNQAMANRLEVHKLSGTSGDVVLVRLVDRKLIDSKIIQEIADELGTLVDAGHIKLVIAFDNVQMLASPMLNALLRLREKLNSKAGALRLCNFTVPVRDVFIIPKLDKIFVIKDTEKDALTDI